MLFSILIVAFFIFFIFFPRYICFKVPGDCKFYFPYVQCDLHTILTYKKALAQVLSDFLRFLTCFQNHVIYMLRYNRCLFWVWVITYFFVCICNAKKPQMYLRCYKRHSKKGFLKKCHSATPFIHICLRNHQIGEGIQEWSKYDLWKTTFKKFYLVHSWIPWPKCGSAFFLHG